MRLKTLAEFARENNVSLPIAEKEWHTAKEIVAREHPRLDPRDTTYWALVRNLTFLKIKELSKK